MQKQEHTTYHNPHPREVVRSVPNAHITAVTKHRSAATIHKYLLFIAITLSYVLKVVLS